MKLILAFTMVLAALAAPLHAGRSVIVTSQDHSIEGGDDCATFHTQNMTSFASHVTAQETREFAVAPRTTVRVVASDESGVSVRGSDRSNARLLICKCAAAATPQQARHVLDAVTVTVNNSEVRATGPEINETQIWWAHMILLLPRDAKVAVDSSNGGIAVRNVSGGVTATTTNGGISLDRVAGTVNAKSENGPISLKVRQKKLPSIVARTEESGMILCNLKSCSDGSGAWANDRKQLSLAGGGSVVRLSTSTAPIVIEQVR